MNDSRAVARKGQINLEHLLVPKARNAQRIMEKDQKDTEAR